MHVIFYALRDDEAAVTVQELHRALPLFQMLHVLIDSRFENNVFSNLSLQATHCQRPRFFQTHALQMRS